MNMTVAHTNVAKFSYDISFELKIIACAEAESDRATPCEKVGSREEVCRGIAKLKAEVTERMPKRHLLVENKTVLYKSISCTFVVNLKMPPSNKYHIRVLSEINKHSGIYIRRYSTYIVVP